MEKEMGQVLVVIMMGIFLTLVLLEVASGCGEPTYFQDRTWVTGECLFIPYTPTAGRW